MLDTSTFPSPRDRFDGRFAEAVLKAVKGEKGVIQPSFVYLSGVPGGDAVQKSVDGLEYFSTNVELGVFPPPQRCFASSKQFFPLFLLPPIPLFELANSSPTASPKLTRSANSLHTRRSCSKLPFPNSRATLRSGRNSSPKHQSCKLRPSRAY